MRIKLRNVSLCIEIFLKYPCSPIGIKMSIPFRAFWYCYFVIYLGKSTVVAAVLLVIFAKLCILQLIQVFCVDSAEARKSWAQCTVEYSAE